MTRLAQTLAAVVPVAVLAACGSTPMPPDEASADAPMVYVSSLRSPSSIASCLKDRLPRVRTSKDGQATELAVGSSSHASYFVTLTPSSSGSVVRVTHDPSASNDPPEGEMRFHIARCTI
ncbi:MAG TPA: sugar ABC transporter ATPase [Paraburkholderia sp.]|nr:sugar ABC transporter ATPase [Paraburkholderia sp.]